ncbi:MAG: hypothetical protein GEU80_02295 [Dehalococcoidia bacterium]|nr:hypothetical protein [Dehalococcoidia bacterium]
MPNYIAAQYGDKRRYLLKALREVSHRIERLVTDLDEPALRERPAGEDWCVKEVVGFLRDSEREDLRSIQAIVARDGVRIEERRAYLGPGEQDYTAARIEDLVWDFAMLREETTWMLRTAGGSWDSAGVHPYRGEVTLLQLVQEMNERDLDAMWRIQRLRDRLLPAAYNRDFDV